LAADQVSKALVRWLLPLGKSLDVGLFSLRQVRNPGTAFGLIRGQSLPFFLGSVALLLVLMLVLWRFRREEGRVFTAALGLIIGGALGNIVDRIALGAVVDFIDLRFWPVFNLADTAIVFGVGMALAMVIRDVWREGKNAARG
ncbi:MAG: signal peptidase II, partial [Actinomycetota bacterium]|nr:signal peptidase II [Actinomycetota bacterium]